MNRLEDIVDAAETTNKKRPPKPPVRRTRVRHVLMNAYMRAQEHALADLVVEEAIARGGCHPERLDTILAHKKRVSATLDTLRRVNAATYIELEDLPEERSRAADALARFSAKLDVAQYKKTLDAADTATSKELSFRHHVSVAPPTQTGTPAARPRAR